MHGLNDKCVVVWEKPLLGEILTFIFLLYIVLKTICFPKLKRAHSVSTAAQVDILTAGN